VKLNCASLAEGLLEAELFGHEKGAFTGADRQRPGLFETARGGTLFLDEIGDIPASLQVRLLRVLQEREVLRVGARKPLPVDFRLVAATHRDLDARVKAGLFREDLLFRLRVVELRVPPLRERREDIPALADRLLRRHAARNAVPFRPLSPGALSLLMTHPFPGNVRQLEHLLERALVLAAGDEIAPKDLEIEAPTPPRDLREAVEALERSAIEAALSRCGRVRAQAAKMLGLHDRVLRYKMRKYGIDP
jgi:two-component system NtrC family response regulator